MNDYIHLIDHEGAAWVKIYSVGTSEMNDYNRAGVNNGNWSRYGAVDTLDATLDEYKLERDRSFTFVLDKLDVDDIIYDSFIISEQTREVLIQRFGFDGLGEKTLDEVGLNLGLTKCRISQICNKSLKKEKERKLVRN